MKSREKSMAMLVLALITATCLGMLYFMYYDRNVSSLNNRQRGLSEDLDRDSEALATVQKAIPRLKAAKRVSLPADVSLARRDYGTELEKMLTASEFPADKFMVIPKQQENRTNVPASKRPPFQRVNFDIQAHGDLAMLLDFLERFYNTPLLHRVKSLTITRPPTAGKEQIPGELDINLSLEALILDGAENRKTLLPEGLKEEEKPKRLARPTAQYEMIAGNNVFFGPPPPAPVDSGDPKSKPDFEILPEIVLDGIWIDEKGVVATLFDAADDYLYQIRKRYDGTFRVDRYYFIKDKRKPLDIGEEMLVFKDANDFAHRSFKVARIDATDVLLEEKGKYFRLHIGARVSDVIALTSDEAAKMGLQVKEEKKDDKGKEKPEAPKTAKDTGR